MNIRQKNYILLSGFITVLWIAYELAFAPTFVLMQKANTLKQQEKVYKNTIASISELQLQNNYYNELLTSFKISSDISLQSNLLEIVNNFSIDHKLTIISFEEPHLYTENNNHLNTYGFKIRGSYKNILKLIYNLEQKYKFGKVSSVSFEKKKNYKTYKYFLDCEIFMQKIKQ